MGSLAKPITNLMALCTTIYLHEITKKLNNVQQYGKLATVFNRTHARLPRANSNTFVPTVPVRHVRQSSAQVFIITCPALPPDRNCFTGRRSSHLAARRPHASTNTKVYSARQVAMTVRINMTLTVWALVDPGVLYGMPKYGEHVEFEPIGSGGRVPSGVHGQCPWWGQGASPPWS